MSNDKEQVMSDYIKQLEQENIKLRTALCNLRDEYLDMGGDPNQLELFDKDFEEALKNAETLIGDRPVNFVAKQVLIEMVFQLGIGGVGKFKKMWSALDSEDYGEASFQMMDSLWAKQTPKRAAKLSAKMRSAKA